MRATEVLPAGTWDTKHEVDHVLIDYDHRFRRRIVLATVAGVEVLVDLPQAVRLRHGDGLKVENGDVIRVCAQAEDLMEIHAHLESDLIRIAWHLGNRHLPVQLLDRSIRIRADHVIGAMVEGLGGHVETISDAFEPEAGAYSARSPHNHDSDDADYHHHV